MDIYDSIGKKYSTTRVPDHRIVKSLIKLLNLTQGSIIADIGAGTGGYSLALADEGFLIYAIEPSSVMRTQAIADPQVEWFIGYAEALPLPDKSVDALISILAIHHFSNLEKSFREMHRVVNGGAILLLTFDIRLSQKIWLYDYFPWLWEDASRFLTLEEQIELIEFNTQRNVEIFPFLLPYDLSDLFAAAAWRRPDLYLKPEVRAGISSFALTHTSWLEQSINSLSTDLKNGQWEAKYGEILKLTEIDMGYRFLLASKNLDN
ncbi:class I SAM-dependent methyltransferase [Aetokthonos hydrillicola Thurmond2011]|jgi:ubiquinone/menaquinone biosynthesis C-methylase UbiE|uniref:Class I SAM-dependent methyltransferase n=1 Tax=Aetokthonos hydrillicola Thurmond2011 TaxID=2712845 RepID=A0AAP5I1I6_9CYAN|nr:class I SAM-dependent methyltransferase [Aetokthonos hydrillicola]MBO3460134.1 class I SAM-dependent methyltransferase [Aetokthonos hydrillicola CCALA 1050]MBW4590460.1 class I SAM-dependent methyltransferase [Aetokthonos hydrillicola CCALA 1050]MDR9892990.1 class I SAM-dependent methyltransferase [Aetokthonos hydrillicola Thurmond2011]